RECGQPGSGRLLEFAACPQDQLQVDVLPGMEVGTVGLGVGASQRAQDTAADPQPGKPVAPDFPACQQPVAAQHVQQPLDGVQGKEERALQHRPAAQPDLAADLLVQIEGDSLVLALFQCVPAPQACHVWISASQP